MRKQLAYSLIPFSPRGAPGTVHKREYEYFFTDTEYEEMLRDPKCNMDVFKEAAQEYDDIRTFQNEEKWYISEEALLASSLGHWRDRGTRYKVIFTMGGLSGVVSAPGGYAADNRFLGMRDVKRVESNSRADAFLRVYNDFADEGIEVTVVEHVDSQEAPLGFLPEELEYIKQAGARLKIGYPTQGVQIEQIAPE